MRFLVLAFVCLNLAFAENENKFMALEIEEEQGQLKIDFPDEIFVSDSLVDGFYNTGTKDAFRISGLPSNLGKTFEFWPFPHDKTQVAMSSVLVNGRETSRLYLRKNPTFQYGKHLFAVFSANDNMFTFTVVSESKNGKGILQAAFLVKWNDDHSLSRIVFEETIKQGKLKSTVTKIVSDSPVIEPLVYKGVTKNVERADFDRAKTDCTLLEKDFYKQGGNFFILRLGTEAQVAAVANSPKIKALFDDPNDADRCIWTKSKDHKNPGRMKIWSYKSNAIGSAEQSFLGCKALCFFN